jgi:hypothetical protein
MTNSSSAGARRGVPLGYILAAVLSVQALIVAVALLSSTPGWL